MAVVLWTAVLLEKALITTPFSPVNLMRGAANAVATSKSISGRCSALIILIASSQGSGEPRGKY